MARSITYREAINEALAQEMERDPTRHRDGRGQRRRRWARRARTDAWGGVLGVTKGLYHKFPGRVLDTPISESAFIGAAVGAATGGLRPVAELMFIDFMGVCFDQIFNQAAKFRYMFGGKAVTPVVDAHDVGRRAAGGGPALAVRCYPVFTHIPGLKVVAPSNAYDAKGLLIQSIRDDDPVIFFEHKMLYDVAGDVPEESYTIPFGEANVVREGGDVTIVAIGRMVHDGAGGRRASWRRPVSSARSSTRARSSPLDTDTILEAVENTGRLVVVDEANPRCSLATDIAATVAQDAFGSLRAPIQMVTGAAHAGAVRRLAGRPVHPGRREDRRGGQDGRGLEAMTDERILRVTMPKWGLSMKTGKIVEWFVAEGDTIDKGDDVVDIETDKIAGTLESPVGGLLRRIIAEPGADLPVGAVLAVVAPAEVVDADVDAVVEEAQAAIASGALEEDEGPQPQLVEVGGRTISYLTLGARTAASPWCWCTGSAATRTRGCSCSSRCREDRAVTALDLPGHGASAKDVGDGSLETLAGVVTGFLDAVGIEPGAPGGAFARRCGGRGRGEGGAGAGWRR